MVVSITRRKVETMAPTIRGNSLYTLTTNGSWTASESFAIQLGGHLVTVNDAAENGWLTSTMLGSSGKWIGYYQTGPNSGYRWVSGESSSFSSWYPGFPDFPSWELYAYLGGSGGWFDCNNEGGGNLGLGQGIAEIPLILSITRSTTPKEGTGPFTTSINLSAGTQSSGNLAESSQVWWKVTGITQDDLASGALTGSGTITNGKLDIQHSLVADADPGEQFSVSVYSDSGMTQQIGTTSSVAVQEAPIVRGNSLYTIVDGPSWTQAEANAVRRGGHLVTVNEREEEDLLYKSFGQDLPIYQSTSLPAKGLWIGLTDSQAEGVYKWVSGDSSTWLESTYKGKRGLDI